MPLVEFLYLGKILIMNKNTEIEFIKLELKKIHTLFLTQMYEEVIIKTRLLLKKDKYQIPFYNYIGLSYRQLNKLDLAEDTFLKGLILIPNEISLLCNLGSIYRLKNEFLEAKKCFEKVLKINPVHFTALCNFGNLNKDLSRINEALELYEKAYLINAEIETLLINLATTYQAAGKFEQSKKIINELNIKFPNSTYADHLLSRIHFYEKEDEHQKRMIEKTYRKNINIADRVYLNFALSKSYSDQKNYQTSTDHLLLANKAKSKLLSNYNFLNESKLFESIKNEFTNFKFNNDVLDDTNLIFIVGLPRSGTTLIHQIISSHSKVFGAGELSILGDFFNKKMKDEVFIKKFFDKNTFNSNETQKLSNEILSLFKQFNSQKIILDKMPLNYKWIGFIKILFPNAKIIHCKRNLKDTALSIYKNMFEGNALPWTYNEDYLVNYINLYIDLMDFWHSSIPGYIYDCEYEQLVDNQEEEIHKILQFCNLEFEKNCLDFTKNSSIIKTISVAQANKPIYKTSVNISDKYKGLLNFLDKISS